MVDVSRAQLSNLGDQVVLVDPGWPWTIRVQLSGDWRSPTVLSLAIESRNGQGITPATLSQLPLRQIAGVAASAMAGEGEAQLRMLARPRPHGRRNWPPEHFERVARVASWARAIERPGGAAEAVAEFWNVHYRTACRWIARLPQA